MKNSRNGMLVSDAMKFTRAAPLHIGPLSQIDVFVTERPPPDLIVDLCKHNGLQIEIVNLPTAVAAESE